MTEQQNCETCQFSRIYNQFQDTPIVCNRFPPVPLMHHTGEVMQGQPRTWPSDWCGEWKEKVRK